MPVCLAPTAALGSDCRCRNEIEIAVVAGVVVEEDRNMIEGLGLLPLLLHTVAAVVVLVVVELAHRTDYSALGSFVDNSTAVETVTAVVTAVVVGAES